MCTSRRSSRLGAALGLVLALGPVGRAGAESPGSLVAFDGHAWRALPEGEKLAVLTGFLIGGAFEQGLVLSPGDAGPNPAVLESLRREGRLRFPYAPAVYKARLEDFYFYEDRRSVPLYRALLLINEQIRKGGR